MRKLSRSLGILFNVIGNRSKRGLDRFQLDPLAVDLHLPIEPAQEVDGAIGAAVD
jgi:hypothetical protein